MALTNVPILYATLKVIAARKKYKIKYPNLYAPENHEHKKEFDCTQRAHQNTLELYPMLLFSTFIVGLTYPMYASFNCCVWSVGRILYVHGYAQGVPNKRRPGAYVSDVPGVLLIISMFYVGVSLVR